jgi:hypothetical protein
LWDESNVHFLQGDVRKLPESVEGRFDLIVTDAFLTRFAPEEVPEVLRALAIASNPEAKLVTTVRVSSPDLTSQEHADRLDKFVSRAVAGASNLNIPEDAVERLSRNYAARMRSRPFGDTETVANRFRSAGWEVQHVEVAHVKGELVPTTYARFVTRRTKCPM